VRVAVSATSILGIRTDTGKNFTKFMIDRSGNIVGRFEPKVTPEQMAGAIEAELKKK
jgi:glutathione peroxidase-family protein